MVSGRKALIQAGLDKERSPEGYAKLDLTRTGVLIGTGMGGLTAFQDGAWDWGPERADAPRQQVWTACACMHIGFGLITPSHCLLHLQA